MRCERAVSEWTIRGTRADGTRVEVQGCELFTCRDGKIAVKNSCCKSRPLNRAFDFPDPIIASCSDSHTHPMEEL